jgi:CRP/FNR family cyclic AMP-dependent transcriptional regulator
MELTKHNRVDLLRSVWLFEGCTHRQLDQLATVAAVRAIPAGRHLSREGDPHREFMVIVDGKAEVTRHGQYIATLGPGDFVGEMSLLDRTDRVATVIAAEPTTLLAMTGANFDMILRDHPTFARNLLTVVSRRLRDLETRYIKPPA